MGFLWHRIALNTKELNIDTVLRCGQSFRWKYNDGVWSIGMKNRIVLLNQEDQWLNYASIPEKEDTLDILNDYFNLKIKLETLYKEWSTNDPKFKTNVEGIRILRQDPWENLVSFICSTNNNIKRITQMVDKLCVNYGEYIGKYGDIDYYEFPEPEKLAKGDVEQMLRKLAFGYRAPYIVKTAKRMLELDENYLMSLRELPYDACHEALTQFTGVGPKVADCVCLMSCDKHQVVPIDTHVWQIAQRDYKVAKKYSKLNKQAYQAVAEHFVKIWGPYAGWAHSVMFTADLNLVEVAVVKKERAASVQIAEEKSKLPTT